MRTYSLATVALLLASSTSFALPPNAAPGLVPGANHHTGDDGFVADLGREPKPGEEKLRMHEHFVAVRARLAGRPATRPELEPMRAKLIAALDAYIARGTTPDNDALPWRTPVFIDDKHTICAVGYLIEQSAGRALAEKIAASHRYSFIEDIAKDMPEVRDWVAQSGFTLDELGQIQPGYQGPDVLLYHGFQLAKDARNPNRDDDTDGPYDTNGITGVIQHRKLEGAWLARNDAGAVTGAGQFHRGAGPWVSLYDSGQKMAEGAFAHNLPNGKWRFFHASGHVAAEGRFEGGVRVGAWRFYYDDAAQTPVAIGKFDATGYVAGTWKHYDGKGALLATSTRDDIPSAWKVEQQLFWVSAYRLDISPSVDGITHRIHQGSLSGDTHRLDELATKDGRDRVYMNYDANLMYDDSGHKLVQVDGGWRADDCQWTAARKRAARAGELPELHGMLYQAADDVCTTGGLVPAARAAQLSKFAAAMKDVRAVPPEVITDVALGDDTTSASLTDVLAANMALDIVWPHVDGRFIQVFKTLPGFREG